MEVSKMIFYFNFRGDFQVPIASLGRNTPENEGKRNLKIESNLCHLLMINDDHCSPFMNGDSGHGFGLLNNF